MKKLLLVALAIFPILASAQSPMYGVSPFDTDLQIIDTTTFTATTLPLTSATGVVTGCVGMDADQCGNLFVAYKVGGSRYLGTLDETTGAITEIGVFADNIANIAFDGAGVLYGVTGDGATTSETLYTIDVTNAAMTLVVALGNGSDGESIVYNWDDGLMYHFSGWGATSVIMESINLTTLAITPIALSGGTLSNVGASTYAGNDNFLISDISANGISYISTTGVVTNTSNTTLELKGLAFATSSLSVDVTSSVANDTICPGASALLTCTNTGVTYDWSLDGTSTGATTSTLNATVAGAYVVTIDNGVCVASSDTVNIFVANEIVDVTISNDSICPGDSTVLTCTNTGVTYDWSLDGTSTGITSSTLNTSVAGNYFVTIDNGTCTFNSDTLTVVVLNSPTAVLTPSPVANFCAGDSVEISVNSGGGPGQFQWYMDGAAIAGATTSSYFASTEGSYNCMKTNMNGCSDSAAVATMAIDSCASGLIELTDVSFGLYPNPASSIVTVDFSSVNTSNVIAIKLVGIDGKVVQTLNDIKANVTETTIDVSSVNAGIYFVRIETTQGQITQELIVE